VPKSFPAATTTTCSPTLKPTKPTLPLSPEQTFYFAQSIQHDHTIASKMFNPTTGCAETIDFDKQIWIIPLTN
jgi:hypothetical protein